MAAKVLLCSLSSESWVDLCLLPTPLGRGVFQLQLISSCLDFHVSGLRGELSSSSFVSLWLSAAGLILPVLFKYCKINGLS